jgi:hypothetical protein
VVIAAVEPALKVNGDAVNAVIAQGFGNITRLFERRRGDRPRIPRAQEIIRAQKAADDVQVERYIGFCLGLGRQNAAADKALPVKPRHAAVAVVFGC